MKKGKGLEKGKGKRKRNTLKKLRNTTHSPGDWFELTFGQREIDFFEENPEFLTTNGLRKFQKKYVTKTGEFALHSIASLIEESKDSNYKSYGPSSLKLLINTQDWTQLQAKAEYGGALFGVASTRTSLEGGLKKVDFANGCGLSYNQITNSLWNKHSVQGERSCLATPFSTFQRILTPKVDRELFPQKFEKIYPFPVPRFFETAQDQKADKDQKKKKMKMKTKKKQKQKSKKKKTDKKKKTRKKTMKSQGKQKTKDEEKSDSESNSDTEDESEHSTESNDQLTKDNVKIGIHTNVLVCFSIKQPNDKNRQVSRDNWEKAKLVKHQNKIIINQAFVASKNLNSLVYVYKLSKSKLQEAQTFEDLEKEIKLKIKSKRKRELIRQEILEAQEIVNFMIEGLLRSAIIYQIPLIVIPFLGSGSFCNPRYWTLEALSKNIHLIKKHQLKIVLHYYKINSIPKECMDKMRLNFAVLKKKLKLK
ncbi:hypothetical protein M0813_00214 [Anaeramoeba flamelloides]|uniref:Macro domain-containing protein n=1 Tax=Anaeramoeba flamelloides TaxID=1746091 RepID=A0ABQ8YWW0_9EUKA|nr:hypothetical protein M0813_00214 [Anaeramoeba flamelloides]